MTDANALLGAIDADPDADGPRLVYADFLDDVGQHAHAEFIRLQCELAHLPPASAAAGRLWERIGPVWARLEDDWYPARWCGWGTGDTTDSLDAGHLWRGLMRPNVTVPLATLVECAGACRFWLPTTRLVLSVNEVVDAEAEQAAGLPTLGRVRELVLRGEAAGDWAPFLLSPHLAAVRAVRLVWYDPADSLLDLLRHTVWAGTARVVVTPLGYWYHPDQWKEHATLALRAACPGLVIEVPPVDD